MLADDLWGYRPLNHRAAFLVGADGIVRWAHLPVTITDPGDVLAAIAASPDDRR